LFFDKEIAMKNPRTYVKVAIILAYLILSHFMASYYTNNRYQPGEAAKTENVVLLKPLRVFFYGVLESPKSPKPDNANGTNLDKFIKQNTFLINFVLWPFLVLFALIFWIVAVITTMLLGIVIMLGLIATALIKVAVFLFTGTF